MGGFVAKIGLWGHESSLSIADLPLLNPPLVILIAKNEDQGLVWGWWTNLKKKKKRNHFYPDSLSQINGQKGQLWQVRVSLVQILNISQTGRGRSWWILQRLAPTQEVQTDAVLMSSPISLYWSHPSLNFASPNRSIWNTTSITQSIVKG